MGSTVHVSHVQDNSHVQEILAAEHQTTTCNAKDTLQRMADEARRMWHVENMAISHRLGKLKAGEINLVIAVASVDRSQGSAACQYLIDQFKQRMPIDKIET